MVVMEKCGTLLIQTSQWYNNNFVIMDDGRHDCLENKWRKNIQMSYPLVTLFSDSTIYLLTREGKA